MHQNKIKMNIFYLTIRCHTSVFKIVMCMKRQISHMWIYGIFSYMTVWLTCLSVCTISLCIWSKKTQKPNNITQLLLELCFYMMTSSNGNIFRVTGPLCGEFTGPGEFPTQRSVTRSFDVFFYLRLNKQLSKQPWGWWFETPSWPLWRQCNVICNQAASLKEFQSCLGFNSNGPMRPLRYMRWETSAPWDLWESWRHPFCLKFVIGMHLFRSNGAMLGRGWDPTQY